MSLAINDRVSYKEFDSELYSKGYGAHFETLIGKITTIKTVYVVNGKEFTADELTKLPPLDTLTTHAPITPQSNPVSSSDSGSEKYAPPHTSGGHTVNPM